jgi:hypothetical protein
LPPKGIKPKDFKPSNKRLKEFPKNPNTRKFCGIETLTRGVA